MIDTQVGEPGGLGLSLSRSFHLDNRLSGVDRPSSDDTATDVTPLSTPGLRTPGLDLAARLGEVTLEEEEEEEGRTRGGRSVGSSDTPQEDQGFGSNQDERESYSGV